VTLRVQSHLLVARSAELREDFKITLVHNDAARDRALVQGIRTQAESSGFQEWGSAGFLQRRPAPASR
jgi:hypothetical protein